MIYTLYVLMRIIRGTPTHYYSGANKKVGNYQTIQITIIIMWE